jgi:hypothetical protein
MMSTIVLAIKQFLRITLLGKVEWRIEMQFEESKVYNFGHA